MMSKNRKLNQESGDLDFIPSSDPSEATGPTTTQWKQDRDQAHLTQPESPPILHKLRQLSFLLIISGPQRPSPSPAKLLDPFWREGWPGPDGLLKTGSSYDGKRAIKKRRAS